MCVHTRLMVFGTSWFVANECIIRMAETSVHPRPHFSTFLQSDASAGGDALSYYRHKQYLRKNKTAILQARAGNLPTIQKPSDFQEVKGESAIPKQSSKSPTSVKFDEPVTSAKVN